MRQLLTIAALAISLLGWAQKDNPRTVTDLNFGWRFMEGDIKDGAAVGTDDAAWRTIDLPHDFQIEQPWVEPDPT